MKISLTLREFDSFSRICATKMEHEEFNEWIVRIQERLIGKVAFRFGDELARESFQNVCARICNSPAEPLVNIDSPEAYFLTAMKRECISLQRRKGRDPLNGQDCLLETLTGQVGLVDEVVLKETINNLAECLQSLDEGDRRVLHLRFWMEAVLETIAEHIGRSVETARSRVFKALHKVRRCLEANDLA